MIGNRRKAIKWAVIIAVPLAGLVLLVYGFLSSNEIGSMLEYSSLQAYLVNTENVPLKGVYKFDQVGEDKFLQIQCATDRLTFLLNARHQPLLKAIGECDKVPVKVFDEINKDSRLNAEVRAYLMKLRP